MIGTFGEEGWAAYDQQNNGATTVSGKWGDSIEFDGCRYLTRPASSRSGGA